MQLVLHCGTGEQGPAGSHLVEYAAHSPERSTDGGEGSPRDDRVQLSPTFGVGFPRAGHSEAAFNSSLIKLTQRRSVGELFSL